MDMSVFLSEIMRPVSVVSTVGALSATVAFFIQKRLGWRHEKEISELEVAQEKKRTEQNVQIGVSIGEKQQMIDEIRRQQKEQDQAEFGATIAARETEIKGLKEDISSLLAQQQILEIQKENMKGAKEYFDISKTQARRSFFWSVFFSALGFLLLASAVVLVLLSEYSNSSSNSFASALIPVIGGAIAEFIAAIAFWVHNKSAHQLNRYYDALHEVEIFLSSVYVAEQVSSAARDRTYAKILDELFNIQKIKAAKPEGYTTPKK